MPLWTFVCLSSLPLSKSNGSSKLSLLYRYFLIQLAFGLVFLSGCTIDSWYSSSRWLMHKNSSKGATIGRCTCKNCSQETNSDQCIFNDCAYETNIVDSLVLNVQSETNSDQCIFNDCAYEIIIVVSLVLNVQSETNIGRCTCKYCAYETNRGRCTCQGYKFIKPGSIGPLT